MKIRSVMLTLVTCVVAALIGMTGASAAHAGNSGERYDVAADDFTIASCYGNQKYFTKSSGITQSPTGNGYWKTTNSCNDINLRLTSGGRYVYVITVGTTKPSVRPWCPSYSSNPSRWTWVPSNSWTVVKWNVPANTHYFVCWSTSNVSNGYRAA